MDKLSGSERMRNQVDSGARADEIVAGWQAELAQFRAVRARYIIYH